MYHTIARKVLETYVHEKKILTIEELGLATDPHLERKDIVFVTVYRDGNVIASSGRVALKKANPVLELIENTLLCLKDPRFGEYVKSAADVKDLLFRIDFIAPEVRRIVQTADEIDAERQGIIFIAQSYAAVSVVLPRMSSITTRGTDLLHLAILKAELDPTTIRPEEYVVYAIESEIFSDF